MGQGTATASWLGGYATPVGVCSGKVSNSFNGPDVKLVGGCRSLFLAVVNSVLKNLA